ncbi:MAG: patatin-like phospholipase family protein [Symbiobacteriia bacterium]
MAMESQGAPHGPDAQKRAGPTLGLALGGGAARCVAHIGVLQVLDENRIPVNLIAGTSGGALVGALYAAGLSPKWLEELAERLNWRHMVKLNLRRDGLLDTEGLERFVATLVKNQTFDDLRLPFAAVAVDLLTGEEVILQEGNVAPAVRASASIPGIFVPIQYRGRVLVDGGVRNNVPVSLARGMGADVVVAVDVGDREKRLKEAPRNLIQVMMASYDILQAAQVERALEGADVVIRPEPSHMSGFDLEHARQYVELGREATKLALPQIRARLLEARLVLERVRAIAAGERTAADEGAD